MNYALVCVQCALFINGIPQPFECQNKTLFYHKLVAKPDKEDISSLG